MTDGCRDERYAKLLYSWELGLLSDDERADFELHLLECDDCYRRAEKFADVAELLRHSSAVRSEVDRQAKETAPVRATESRRFWPSLVKVSLAAAAVLAILILRPWQLEFKPTQEAVAAANRLAIDNFINVENPDDPQHLGTMIAGLLIADLSESGYVQVVSSQRWNDAARLYQEGLDSPTAPLSSLEIARRVSARWLLTGEVAETANKVQLKSQIIDVATGVVVSNQEIAEGAGASLFAAVDRLIREIRSDLSMPDESTIERERSVAQVTTTSREAYRCYVEGLEYAARYYNREAIAAFEQALSYDSTFAMSWYQLALLKSPKLISQAMRYSGHASWLEQRYIRATDAEIGVRYEEMREQLREIMSRFPDEKEAYFKLGQYYWRQRQLDSALAYLNRTVEIDPTHREAYNYLMYAYNEAGRFDLAVLAIDKYISLAPGEANPYDSRGDLLAQNGKPLDAADSYLKALRIKPDFTASAVKLALLWIYAHDLQHADSLMQALAQSPNEATRNSAKYLTALIPVYQGKFNGALEVIDSLAKDGEQAQLYELKARIYAERGQFAQARAALDRAIATLHESSPQDSVTFGYLQAHYLAALGDLAGAESIRRRLAAHTQATGESPCYEYWAAGGIELALGNPVEAAKQLERGTAITTIATDFTGNFLLARAYFEAGRPGESVTLFEKLTEVYSSGRLLSPIENVKLHYFLGQAYEESRWYDQAAQQYRMFLSFWSEPDSDLTSVDDARARLKRLENRL